MTASLMKLRNGMILTRTADMYILFNIHTHKIVNRYQTESGARGQATKLAKAGKIVLEDHCIMPVQEFRAIEKTETVYSLMTGAPVVQPVNTPLCCDPSSETYWSM